MRDAFKALSSDALKQTQPEFLRLANETFSKAPGNSQGDLAQRQEAIKGLVEPLRQQLESYQTRLQQSTAAQSSTLGEVKKQLELLSQQSAVAGKRDTTVSHGAALKPGARALGRGNPAAGRGSGRHERALRLH